jgi:3-hydroxyisobutyrate dehydrogenase-like beta-hydroxyacid dehydrogenase
MDGVRETRDNRFMSFQTVAILAPGDMGHAVGAVLRQGGLRIITNLAGRSQRTAQLAKAAGIEPVADDKTLVGSAEILLSIVPPAEAPAIARRVAAALRAAPSPLVYVECNAISPRTTCEVGDIVGAAGAAFVDGGIIGPPPKAGDKKTRLYVSGAEAARVVELARPGFEIRTVDGAPGAASALKMCYASMTKGVMALATQALVTAGALGVSEALRAEMAQSRADVLADIDRNLPRVPPKAYRWVGEMEEIASTFGDAGFPPQVFEGIARIYRMVADSPLGRETPEARSRGATVADYVSVLAGQLVRKDAAD